MSIMTAEQYQERKAALVSAISHAEGEFQSASFKELTGNESPDASKKAKHHLELLREELVKVEAAWVASQTEIERLRVKGIAEDFDFAAAEIDALLVDRKKALRDVIKAAEAATRALARYQELTGLVRAKSWLLGRNALGGSGKIQAQVASALGINIAETAFSAILNTAHVSLSTSSFLRDAFPNGDAVAQEDRIAGNVRAAVRATAPQAEAV